MFFSNDSLVLVTSITMYCYSFTYHGCMEGWFGLSTMSVSNFLKVVTHKWSWWDSNHNLWVICPRTYHYSTEPPGFDWLYKCKKTVVDDTHVNGDTFNTTAKIINRWYYPSSHHLLSMCCWIISPFYDFCCFTCTSPLTPSSQLGHCQLDESQCHVITARRSVSQKKGPRHYRL